MRRVRGKNTGPELLMRRLLSAGGYRYRKDYILHPHSLPGTPDVAFPARRRVILVHGCFWHAHKCRYGRAPKSHRAFWSAKRRENRERDRRTRVRLRRRGWTVLTVWQCQLRRHPGDLAAKVGAFLGPATKR